MEQSLYFSKLSLNIESSTVRKDLGDSHAMHRRIMSGFSDDKSMKTPRKDHGVLYAISNLGDYIIVQSLSIPNWGKLPENYTQKPVEIKKAFRPLSLIEGTTGTIRARLCPTICKKREGKRGKRYGLPAEEFHSWFSRRLDDAGFKVYNIECGEGSVSTGFRDGARITHIGTDFCAEFTVVNPELAKRAVAEGLGSGKSHGFGMLKLFFED